MASSAVSPAELLSLVQTLQASLPGPTQAAAQLPSAQDLAFERTLSRSLGKKLDTESDRILALVSSVLEWADLSSSSTGRATAVDGDLIKDGEYRAVAGRVEGLLEAADDGIEKHLGLGKAKKGGVGALGAKAMKAGDEVHTRTPTKERLAPHLTNAVDVEKPQLLFTQRTQVVKPPLPTEEALTPSSPIWTPILRSKQHATTLNLKDSLVVESFQPTDSRSITTGTQPPAYPRYTHPYATEIEALTPPASFFVAPPKPTAPSPKSFEQTPFAWVATKEELKKMADEIREVGKDERKRELAIDLEHHDLRSYTGITCLIQLSTREKDYVIDALDAGVRDSLDSLNEFFADPSWVKVLHGAASDIIWLQRDFGLYIVGLFDTYHATHVLEHAQHSLASLLAMYTNFEPDKRYQLADWRIRPLTKEMLHYARSDTHFLLDIYDHLRLALHARAASPIVAADSAAPSEVPTAESLLLDVFNRSKGVSSQVFSIAPYDFVTGHSPEGGWLTVLAKYQQLKPYATARSVPTMPIKTGWGPGEPGLEVLRKLHLWREKVAIEEDESIRHIFNNSALYALAEKRPTEPAQIMQAVGNAKGGVGEVLRKRKDEVAAIIRELVTTAQVEEEHVGAVFELQRGEAASEPAVRPVSGSLWDEEPVASTSIIAAASSFFGRAASSNALAQAGLVAGSSSFFGGSTKQSAVQAGKQPSNRNDAIARVHASLILGGGLAKTLTPGPIPEPVVAAVVEEVVDPAAAEPLKGDAALTGDHSFVPFSDRAPKQSSSQINATSKAPAPSDKDVLVVSSLADKPKKRRRPKVDDAPTAVTAGDELDSSSPAKKVKEEKKQKASKGALERLAPHDYSTSPSILDGEGSGLTKAERKKKETGRAAKGFKLDTSGFRREPRVNNQPKKANWGDEGKGKLVDILAAEADVCARCAGGNNAGHTIVATVNGVKTKFDFHLLPSGLVNPDCVAFIGNGVVVHIPAFFDELDALTKKGLNCDGRLLVSDRAHLVFDFHQIVDGLKEVELGGSSIGTTKRGIGPAYSSKASRSGLRVHHLYDPTFEQKFRKLVEGRFKRYGNFEYDTEAEIVRYRELAARLKPYVVDMSYVHKAIASGKRVLCEGANALMLDIDFGTYPFVTSSPTGIAGVSSGLGLPPRAIGEVYGVVKAYTTRVGGGPFPTEQLNAVGESLQEVGQEWGVTTGRRRRCGWLDLVVLKYSHLINGYTALNLTKLDVLDGFKEIKVGVAYHIDGKPIDAYFPADLDTLAKVEVIYETLPGWESSIQDVKSYDDLPVNCRKYIEFIEKQLGVPIGWIGTGPAREAMISKPL